MRLQLKAIISTGQGRGEVETAKHDDGGAGEEGLLLAGWWAGASSKRASVEAGG